MLWCYEFRLRSTCFFAGAIRRIPLIGGPLEGFIGSFGLYVGGERPVGLQQ